MSNIKYTPEQLGVNHKILPSYFDRVGELLEDSPRTRKELAVDMYENPVEWGLEEGNPDWEAVDAKKVLSKDPETEEMRERWKNCQSRINELYAILSTNLYISSNYGHRKEDPIEIRSDKTVDDIKSINLISNIE